MDRHPGQRDRGERLVDLEQVDVGDGHAGPCQHPHRRLDRAVQVVVGLGADQGLGQDPGPRPQAEFAGPVRVGQQQRGRPVGDLRGGARRVQAALDHRLEPGQPLPGRLAQSLVPVHHPGARAVRHGRLDRDDFPVEMSLGPRPLG